MTTRRRRKGRGPAPPTRSPLAAILPLPSPPLSSLVSPAPPSFASGVGLAVQGRLTRPMFLLGRRQCRFARPCSAPAHGVSHTFAWAPARLIRQPNFFASHARFGPPLCLCTFASSCHIGPAHSDDGPLAEVGIPVELATDGAIMVPAQAGHVKSAARPSCLTNPHPWWRGQRRRPTFLNVFRAPPPVRRQMTCVQSPQPLLARKEEVHSDEGATRCSGQHKTWIHARMPRRGQWTSPPSTLMRSRWPSAHATSRHPCCVRLLGPRISRRWAKRSRRGVRISAK